MPETDMDTTRLFEGADHHLMGDNRPSAYFSAEDCPVAKSDLFTPVFALRGVKQSPMHHSEGDAFVHTMLVIDRAGGQREAAHEPRVFMWAALLHDIGKATTTRHRGGKITSYDHDKAGEKLAFDLLQKCGQPHGFATKVAAMVSYHMHPLYVLKGMPFADLKGMRARVDLDDLALLALCDRLGRGGADLLSEGRDIERFLKIVNP